MLSAEATNKQTATGVPDLISVHHNARLPASLQDLAQPTGGQSECAFASHHHQRPGFRRSAILALVATGLSLYILELAKARFFKSVCSPAPWHSTYGRPSRYTGRLLYAA
jgi:hypothetical protein